MLPCHGRDAITSGGSSLAENETLVSAGKTFELGFFQDEQHLNWYVGIWYYNLNPRTIVWVANRDSPILDSSGGVVVVKEDGNLYVLDGTGATCFIAQLDTTPSSKSYDRTARLLDSADTFLPGMKMDEGLTLTSWESSGHNPTIGSYTFSQDPDPAADKYQYIILKRTVTYWKGGVGDRLTSLSGIPTVVYFLLSNFSEANHPSLSSYHKPRIFMSSSGQIQFYIWDNSEVGWSLQWAEPSDNCSVYNFCGMFATCSINNNGSLCKCLPGFKPTNPDDWRAEEFSGGCSMPEPTCSALIDCENWPNSICNATKQRQGRCQCKSAFKWDALSLNCTSVMTEAGSSVMFRSVIIFISVILALVILCSIGYIIYRRNLVHERKDQENDLFTEDDKKAIDIPFFNLEIILAATDSFSDANKLGQGGFGPVYKAWKFWVEEKALDMMDPTLLSCSQSEVLKCINMGLLCVQEDPNDRPTMSNVVIMLVTESMSLPRPKQPAFVARRRVEDRSSSSSKKSAHSKNEVTTSVVEGR
nr:G-type lectin S-receptor-like serine/threonine-protein kinase At4g03230 [Ipomoea batatas]